MRPGKNSSARRWQAKHPSLRPAPHRADQAKREPFHAEELADVSPAACWRSRATGKLPAILWSLPRVSQMKRARLCCLLPLRSLLTKEERFVETMQIRLYACLGRRNARNSAGRCGGKAEPKYGWIEPDVRSAGQRQQSWHATSCHPIQKTRNLLLKVADNPPSTTV